MNRYDYFVTPIYREEKPEWVNDCSFKLKSFFDNKLPDQPNTDNLVERVEFSHIRNFFLEQSFNILNDQGYVLGNEKFLVSALWGQQHGPGSYNIQHTHPNSIICGLYFLKTPENGSYPVFADPRIKKTMTQIEFKRDELYISSEYVHFNNIIPGTFLFFNSWVDHQITLNNSNDSTDLIHFILKVI